MRVSNIRQNIHFWVNYPFNTGASDDAHLLVGPLQKLDGTLAESHGVTEEGNTGRDMRRILLRKPEEIKLMFKSDIQRHG